MFLELEVYIGRLSTNACSREVEAETLHEHALAIRQRILESDNPQIASSLKNLADVYSALGRLEESEQLHLKALAIRERGLWT